MERDPLDALIDETARSLTEGVPRRSLRATVRARVESGRPFLGLPKLRWSGGGTGRLAWSASAAVVVLAFVVGRTLLGPPGEPDQARPTSNRPTEAVAITPAEERAPLAIEPATAPRIVERREQALAVEPPAIVVDGAEAVPEDLLMLEDLLMIEPVEIEPLVTEMVDVELMEAPMPLPAERIDIEPIAIE